MVAEVEAGGDAAQDGESSIGAVPGQVYEWKAAAETRMQAQQVQEKNREQFLRAFSHGLAVLGYERDDSGNGRFLLGKWNEKWSYASEE